MCGTGSNPPKCMGSAVYGPGGCTCPTCGALPCDQVDAPFAAASGEELARRFHDAYERLAPAFGYETRQETRTFDPASANGQLMIAVCAELLGIPA